jgi:trimeric autotransporter adhesin
MAQTGFTPIQLYSTSTAAAAPVAGNLTNSTLGSELAINITDGKLFYKDNANAVQVIGWKTVPTTAGGTGLTTYTAGDLSYYATGTTFTKLAIGTIGQILTSTGSAPQWSTLSGVAVTTFSAGTTGFTPNSATSGAITLAGTLATTNGGTGLTAFTANRVFYASSTSAIGSSANLTFNGTTLIANDITDSSLTSGRVTYAGASGNLVDSANLTFNGTTLTTTGISTSNNLAFTGTGNRITGDFSTSVLVDRVSFQSSTTNGNTIISAIPNGTATTGTFQVWNNSTPTNAAGVNMQATSTEATIRANTAGSGTALPLTIYTGGSERVRIDTSGNFGLFTTSPSTFGKFAVQGAAATRVFYADSLAQPVARYDDNSFINNGFTLRNTGISGTNQGIGLLFQLGASGTPVDSGSIQLRSTADYSSAGNQSASMTFGTINAGTNTERMRIGLGVSIGNTTDPGASNLTVNGKIFAGIATDGSASAGYFYSATIANTNIGVVRIESGKASDSADTALSVIKKANDSTTAQVYVRFLMNAGSTASGQINANGANTAAFGTFSDARLKENIVDLPPQLANIMALRPVEFDYIESEGGGHQIGFIAQNIEKVYPDTVGHRADGMKTVTAWSKTEARLVKAIQEQQKMIEDLKKLIEIKG